MSDDGELVARTGAKGGVSPVDEFFGTDYGVALYASDAERAALSEIMRSKLRLPPGHRQLAVAGR